MTLTRDLDSTTAALDPFGADAVMRALPEAQRRSRHHLAAYRAERLSRHAAPARVALRNLA
ncbi:hypothetical protein C6376_32350 [Streptomyces sp. P3]|nr:hypothetical protein C6376_32350 [Streptomyces sp. P3]